MAKRTGGFGIMSEYAVGLNGEMVHCLDDSEYARYCYSKLEVEIKEEDLKDE